MSGGIPDIAGTGYLPLRHEQPNVDIGLRHVVNAIALQEVDPATPGVWKEAPGSAGDVLGAFFWIPEDGKRSGAGWAFSSWPVKVTTADKSNALTTALRGEGGTKVRPIKTEKLDADERFEEKAPALPIWASRPPKGWPGLVTGATNENKQELVFTPGAHGLVAAEAAGDPDLSTVLLDLDGDDRPDNDRKAHLNAVWRVVKRPTTVPSIGVENGIAWQFGSGRGGRAGFGLITGAGTAQAGGGPAPSSGDGRIETGLGFDGTGGTPAPGASATGSSVPWTIGSVSGGFGADASQSAPVAIGGARHACMSVFGGGPIAIPGPDDAQHQLGADADGNAIMAAAIHTNALFMGPEPGQVGPIAFERGAMPQLQPGNYLTPVHIRYDKSVAHSWSAAAKPGKGMWRLFAESLFYVPPVTTPPTTPDTTPPQTTPPTTPSTTPPETTPPTTPSTTPIVPTTMWPPPTTSSTTPVVPTTHGGGPSTTPSTTPGGGVVIPPPGEGTSTGQPGGGQVTPPTPPGGDRPENPPPRPGGTPSGSIDGPTGLPPHLPKETPGGQNEKTKPRKGDLPPPAPPGQPYEPGGGWGLPIPGTGSNGGWIDPAGELDETPPEWDGKKRPPGESPFPGRTRVTGVTSRDEVALPFVATHMELAVPALLFRAGIFGAGRPDLLNTPRPAEGDIAEHDKTAPVVARAEAAFAAPGASSGSALPSYTSPPGASRYVGGTASGVVGHFPAEVGMRDAASNFAPAGVDVSTVHHTYLREKVLHGSGIPDPTLGVTKSGYTWGASAATTMQHHERNATGGIASTQTLAKVTGTVPVASAITDTALLKFNGATGEATPSGVTDDGTTVSTARAVTVTGVSSLKNLLRPPQNYSATDGGTGSTPTNDLLFIDAGALTTNYDVTLPSSPAAGRRLTFVIGIAGGGGSTITFLAGDGGANDARDASVRTAYEYAATGSTWYRVK